MRYEYDEYDDMMFRSEARDRVRNNAKRSQDIVQPTVKVVRPEKRKRSRFFVPPHKEFLDTTG